MMTMHPLTELSPTTALSHVRIRLTRQIWPLATSSLFPKMKLKLKGRRFDGLEEIQRESQNVLGTLREQDFQHAFQQWQRRWD
jgi:hypothetical protein